MEILEKKGILPAEVLEIIKNNKDKRDLSYIEERTQKYLESINKLDLEKQRELYNKLSELNLPEDLKIKIVEFLPKDDEELKVILYNRTLDKNTIEKILSIVKEYL